MVYSSDNPELPKEPVLEDGKAHFNK